MKHFLLIFFIILSLSDSYTQNKIKVFNYNANNIDLFDIITLFYIWMFIQGASISI